MKLTLLIPALLMALAALLPSVRRTLEVEAHATSLPGKAGMRGAVNLPAPGTAVPGIHPRHQAMELLAAADSLSPGEDFERAFARWADLSPREALEWLSSTRRGGLDQSVTMALAALAWNFPEDAANWLENHPDHAGLDNWCAVLAPWGTTSPSAAHAWVRDHLSEDLKEALRPMMLTTFRDASVTAALVEEGATDGELHEAARGWMDSDPRFAGDLLSRIGSADLRRSATGRLENNRTVRDIGGLVQDVEMSGGDE